MIAIKESKKLTHQKWLNLFDVKYVAKTGDEKSWQLATRKKEPKCVTGRYDQPDAVVMVITREYRVPLSDYEYGFPAGLIDAGESVEQATRRELKEETGLTVSRFIKMSPPIYSSAGMTDESVTMVYVECEGTPSNTGNTEFELIEVLLITPAEAFQMCSDATLKFDAKAWLEISQFAEKRINYEC
jgi:ADP-ribose pyrophosphatase